MEKKNQDDEITIQQQQNSNIVFSSRKLSELISELLELITCELINYYVVHLTSHSIRSSLIFKSLTDKAPMSMRYENVQDSRTIEILLSIFLEVSATCGKNQKLKTVIILKILHVGKAGATAQYEHRPF